MLKPLNGVAAHRLHELAKSGVTNQLLRLIGVGVDRALDDLPMRLDLFILRRPLRGSGWLGRGILRPGNRHCGAGQQCGDDDRERTKGTEVLNHGFLAG